MGQPSDFAAIWKALAFPPAPTPRLVEAAERYRAEVYEWTYAVPSLPVAYTVSVDTVEAFRLLGVAAEQAAIQIARAFEGLSLGWPLTGVPVLLFPRRPRPPRRLARRTHKRRMQKRGTWTR